ncbi:MAG: DNA-processing protein DprA [Acidiferrobacterales bacterium]
MELTPALECWLRLSRAPGIGSRTLITLLESFDSPENIVGASHAQLSKVLGSNEAVLCAITDAVDAERLALDTEWLAEEGSHLLVITDDDYPALLREIPDPPALLYIRGDPAVLSLPQLAMVGSRNPTPGGMDNARAFASALAPTGLLVTSGMALGIDTAAHTGALEGGGSTVAVAGTGVDRIYPARNHALAHRIVEQGALVSEFPLATPPLRENFPQRNRIIAGLSLGTIVIEAALRSGSLITARLASEQGREVFAIPGSIHSPQAKGCHQLIRQGAKLVETATDIMEELGPLVATLRQLSDKPAAGRHDNTADFELLEYLGFDPIDVNTLVERSGLTAEAISSMLLEMELAGHIQVCAGGKVQRINT